LRFDAVFTAEGVRIVSTPAQEPQANAFADRWIRSARRECLDHIHGERHLISTLSEYVAHDNRHRPHQALRQLPPAVDAAPPSVTDVAVARVRRRTNLNGLISEYSQAAWAEPVLRAVQGQSRAATPDRPSGQPRRASCRTNRRTRSSEPRTQVLGTHRVRVMLLAARGQLERLDTDPIQPVPRRRRARWYNPHDVLGFDGEHILPETTSIAEAFTRPRR
jgi:hypothetical protein